MSEQLEVEFLEAQDLGPRTWGKEELLGVLPGKFTFKRLTMRQGTAGGLQYHRKKDEFAFLVSGQLEIRFDDGTGNLASRILTAGSVVHFAPTVVHQEVALTDCVLIEVSTPFLNDRVRVEHQYNLPSSGGLPSTEVDEIVDL